MKKKKESEGTLFTIPVTISLIVLIAIIGACIFAPYLAPYDPDALDFSAILSGPTAQHLLGADKTGRDILSRLLFGGRTTLLRALGVVGISIILGVPVGLFAGYYGGWLDRILMRVTDVIISFPSLLLAFVFVAAFGRGISKSVLALGIIYVPMLAKLTRSLVLMEKNKTYVEACRSIGYGSGRILFFHILPNCISTLLVQLTLDVGSAILDLASLSFLGLGVQAPLSDWGAMLEDGRIYLLTHPGLALSPAICMVVTVVSLNVFVDGVQKYMNPQERKLPSYKKLMRQHRLQEQTENINTKEAAV